jgi:hypothetical protein
MHSDHRTAEGRDSPEFVAQLLDRILVDDPPIFVALGRAIESVRRPGLARGERDALLGVLVHALAENCYDDDPPIHGGIAYIRDRNAGPDADRRIGLEARRLYEGFRSR